MKHLWKKNQVLKAHHTHGYNARWLAYLFNVPEDMVARWLKQKPKLEVLAEVHAAKLQEFKQKFNL